MGRARCARAVVQSEGHLHAAHTLAPHYRGHGGSPKVIVVGMGSVTGDVGVVVPIDDVVVLVNDVAEPLPPIGLTAVPALGIAPGVVVDTPDPGIPTDVVMLVEPGDVAIEELTDPGEYVLLVGIDRLELIDAERGDAGAVGVNVVEIPLLPGTNPVWTLETGLHGSDVVLVTPV